MGEPARRQRGKEPPPRPRLTPAQLWRIDGLPLRLATAELGVSAAQIRVSAKRHGFRRDRPSPTWIEGKCLGCKEIVESELLDADNRCATCAPPPPDPRWGHVPETPEEWLAVEKLASAYRQRMREKDGDADRYARPYVYQVGAGEALPPRRQGRTPRRGSGS